MGCQPVETLLCKREQLVAMPGLWGTLRIIVQQTYRSWLKYVGGLYQAFKDNSKAIYWW